MLKMYQMFAVTFLQNFIEFESLLDLPPPTYILEVTLIRNRGALLPKPSHNDVTNKFCF